MKSPTWNDSTFDINSKTIELTGRELDLYVAHKVRISQSAINLARFGAAMAHFHPTEDHKQHTRKSLYMSVTPCIIQYRLTSGVMAMAVLYNPITSLLELDRATLNGMDLYHDVDAANYAQYAEAFCTTEYGDGCNYPTSVSDAGGSPSALALIEASPTEIPYPKSNCPL